MWLYQVTLSSFLKLQYDLYIINLFFQNVKLSDFWYSHNLMQPSALSNSRIFSSFPKRNLIPISNPSPFLLLPSPCLLPSSSLQICLFWIFHTYRFIQNMAFCYWLLPPNKWPKSSSKCSISTSFLWLNNIPLYGIIHFVYLSINRNLGFITFWLDGFTIKMGKLN